MCCFLEFVGLVNTGSCPSVDDECTYHPGYPVFHEGMKYWSCCQRKTSEFQDFLDQEGCTIGKCKWVDETLQQPLSNSLTSPSVTHNTHSRTGNFSDLYHITNIHTFRSSLFT